MNYNKISNTIALTLIRILTSLTVILLALIIGYIFYKGVFGKTYRKIHEVVGKSSNRVQILNRNEKEIITYTDILDAFEFRNALISSRLKIYDKSLDKIAQIFSVDILDIERYGTDSLEIKNDQILINTAGIGKPLFDIVIKDNKEVANFNGLEADESFMVEKTDSKLSFAYLTGKAKLNGNAGGIGPVIANTLIMLLLTLLIALPIGILTSVYLVEYSKDNIIRRALLFSIDILSVVRSIIFGLFGMLVFVQLFGFSFSILSGSLTLVIMILPTIIKTTVEALQRVPTSLKEASYALGSTKTECIYKVIIPYCSSAIISATILASGRAIGETAALLYTMGSGLKMATSIFTSARSLASHIYLTISEGQGMQRAFLAAVVLLVFILILNTLTKMLLNKFNRRTS